jgi:Amt family ammonium transporter
VDFPVVGVPDAGDTAWMLASSALVLLMTPGLAFFYGGMVLVGFLLAPQSPASVTGTGATGVLYGGGWHQLGMQAIGAFTVLFYSFFMALIIAFIVKLIFGLRATPEDEELGIDEAEHAETAYDFASVGPGSALSMAGAGKEA